MPTLRLRSPILIVDSGRPWTIHPDLDIPGMSTSPDLSLPNTLTHVAGEFLLREALYLILLRRMLENAQDLQLDLSEAMCCLLTDHEAPQEPPSIFAIRYALYVSHTIIRYVRHAISVFLPPQHLFSHLFSLALAEVSFSHSRLQNYLFRYNVEIIELPASFFF